MTFTDEDLPAIYESELRPLFERHWAEQDSHLGAFALDEGTYRALYDRGLLKLYTVRIGGAIVAYALFLVTNGAHQAHKRVACSDALWVAPEARVDHPFAALALLRGCESALQALGVDQIKITGKTSHPALLEFLTALGYAHEGFCCQKNFGGPDGNRA